MTSFILRMIVFVCAIILFLANFICYAKKKMSETFAVLWSIFSIVLILVSCVPFLAGWSRVMADSSYIAFFLIVPMMIIGMFTATVQISLLIMKNQELAMHVSLINQENETMLRKLKILDSERQERLLIKEQIHEKDIICN